MHPFVKQELAEALDLQPRGREKRRARERIKRNQVDLGTQPVQQAGQTPGIFIAVVGPFQHHVGKRDPLAWSQRQRAAGVQELLQGVAFIHRHQLIAQAIGRGGQGHGQVDVRLLQQAAHLGHQANGRDRHTPGREVETPFRSRDGQRLHKLLVVCQRLAHTHEYQVRQAFSRGKGTLYLPHLTDDLCSGQIPYRPHLRRSAKAAAHRTTNLGRDTQRQTVFGWNEDALNLAVVSQGKQVFARPVSRQSEVHAGQPLDGELLAEQGTRRAR